MKVNSLLALNTRFEPSFKSATVNINALADTHGELFLANSALEEMRQRETDIFSKEGAGNANLLAICGDWFIDGAKKGYNSNPNRTKSAFQLDILNAFISQIKKIASNTIVLFTPGNHEFDGGVSLLDKILSGLDAETVMTNLNLLTSSGFSKSISADKVVNEKIIEVDDDKNPDLKHKLLFLGISPVNLQYYQKNLDGISLINNSPSSQKNVSQSDYQATLEVCQQKIDEFKKENPDGFVVLMSHTGVNFAENLVKIANVDLVFDGHEHKEGLRYVDGTPIISMSQNFKKLVNAKVKFDDLGHLSSLEISSYNPTKNKKKGVLYELYSVLFKDDMKKQYAIKSDVGEVKELGIDGVRDGNSYLANFVTDSILQEIKKEDSDVDFFTINSAAIRHPLTVSNDASVSHFDVLDVLAGLKEEDAQIMTTEVSGRELMEMIADNILFNYFAPKQNPIMQYSGLSVDKTIILKAYEMGVNITELYQFVTDTNTGKAISPSKMYKIANVEKYYNKTQNAQIKKLKQSSGYLGFTAQELFERHFNMERDSLVAKFDVRYK